MPNLTINEIKCAISLRLDNGSSIKYEYYQNSHALYICDRNNKYRIGTSCKSEYAAWKKAYKNFCERGRIATPSSLITKTMWSWNS